MLSSRERRSHSSATYSINKSRGCYYQWHGSSTEDKIFCAHSSLAVCKSTLSLGGKHQRRGTFIYFQVLIRGLATPVPRQWGKYIANPKKVNGSNDIVQHVSFLPLISSFVAGNLNLQLSTFVALAPVRLTLEMSNLKAKQTKISHRRVLLVTGIPVVAQS